VPGLSDNRPHPSTTLPKLGNLKRAFFDSKAMRPMLRNCPPRFFCLYSYLSRNAAFTLSLMESGVDFVCCDMPAANTLTIGIMAIINQETRRQISENTKNALQAYKARGGTLGTPANLTDACRAESLRVRRAATKTKMDTVKQVAELLKDTGLTLQATAARLNDMEFKTSRGCAFTPTAVKRLLGV